MEDRFASCCAFTRAEEGGYVADPRDSGNWTSGRVGEGRLVGSNMGVGAPALLAWMGPGATISPEQMRGLALCTYEAIARCNYWSPLGCSKIPPGLDLMVFDFGWNRGVAGCLDVLMRSVAADPLEANAANATWPDMRPPWRPVEQLLRQIPAASVRLLQRAVGIEDDGIIGPETLGAMRGRKDMMLPVAILALSAAQVASYRRLFNFSLYGRGWLARSARRQAAALAAVRMAQASGSVAA